jgi:hypothetical protein
MSFNEVTWFAEAFDLGNEISSKRVIVIEEDELLRKIQTDRWAAECFNNLRANVAKSGDTLIVTTNYANTEHSYDDEYFFTVHTDVDEYRRLMVLAFADDMKAQRKFPSEILELIDGTGVKKKINMTQLFQKAQIILRELQEDYEVDDSIYQVEINQARIEFIAFVLCILGNEDATALEFAQYFRQHVSLKSSVEDAMSKFGTNSTSASAVSYLMRWESIAKQANNKAKYMSSLLPSTMAYWVKHKSDMPA